MKIIASKGSILGDIQHETGKKFARMTLSGDLMSRAYVFLTVPKPTDEDYESYREMRSATLLAYCHGIKLRYPQVTEAIGIASEPETERVASQDFLYVDLTEEMSTDEANSWREMMEELDVLQTPAKDVTHFGVKGHEFPLPFHFAGPKYYNPYSGTPMNRAERRKMAKAARKSKGIGT